MMPRGVSPDSLRNLRPRSRFYGEPKKTREVSVTETGWRGVRALAASLDLSVSELLERLGRDRRLLDGAGELEYPNEPDEF
ncbi:hypothetical protein [Gloeobacter morelensis]|uniref:Uncharacterized protein n=1 Tax=Gloeobacter morelensis MG652769 TaxID=2781736 RepID=A0ABY3PHT7_9CYAN|nr:hypothetical protein [Gloeobacter morelensis]UFP93238.1 hypothetical protein ISF26_15690 [Gloeobacter morelensis MG652769]